MTRKRRTATPKTAGVQRKKGKPAAASGAAVALSVFYGSKTDPNEHHERALAEAAADAERYREHKPPFGDVRDAIMEFLRPLENYRSHRADQIPDRDLRRWVRSAADASESLLPRYGAHTEEVIGELERRYPGIPSHTVVEALRDLACADAIYEADDESAGERIHVWRVAPESPSAPRPDACKATPGVTEETTYHGVRFPARSVEGPQDVRKQQRPMTDGQRAVWDVLEGRALAGKEIAAELGTSHDIVRRHISQLRHIGCSVMNRRGRGYFRPDAPPSDAQ